MNKGFYNPKNLRDPFVEIKLFPAIQEEAPQKYVSPVEEEMKEEIIPEVEEEETIQKELPSERVKPSLTDTAYELTPENMMLIGVLYTPKKRIALIVDARNGKEYLLKEGAKIKNGELIFIGRETAVIKYYDERGELQAKTLYIIK